MFPFRYGFPMANQGFFIFDETAVLVAEFFHNRPILRMALLNHLGTMFVDVNEKFVEGTIVNAIDLERG